MADSRTLAGIGGGGGGGGAGGTDTVARTTASSALNKTLTGYELENDGATLRLNRVSDSDPIDIPVSDVLNDEAVLDLAKASRTSTDRGKLLAISDSDEDELSLLGGTVNVIVRQIAFASQLDAFDRETVTNKVLFGIITGNFTHNMVDYQSGDVFVKETNGTSWYLFQLSDFDEKFLRIPSIISRAVNTIISEEILPGTIYRFTGSSSITVSLPSIVALHYTNASVVLINDSSANLQVNPEFSTSNKIENSNVLQVPANKSVTLQPVTTTEWAIIADTDKGSGGTSGPPDLRGSFGTSATPVAQDRFFFTDENQTDDPVRYVTFNNLLNALVTDDSILDRAKSSRASSDRGKFLGVSSSNENDLTLLDAPSGSGGADSTARAAAATAQAAADAANTLTRKVALLSIYVDPGVAVHQDPATRVNAITGNYRLIITPPDVLTGEDVWIRIFARGTALNNARVKMDVSPAPQFVIPFAINMTTATNINDNDPGGNSVDIEAHFYSSDADAGLFEVRTVQVDVVQTPRVDDKQALLPNLGNGQVWLSRGSGVVAGTPPAGPSLIISNIASYDATQNRFEDSRGNEIVVPDGAIVTLTQAIYDAAVSDAGFTPNANAIFLTR